MCSNREGVAVPEDLLDMLDLRGSESECRVILEPVAILLGEGGEHVCDDPVRANVSARDEAVQNGLELVVVVGSRACGRELGNSNEAQVLADPCFVVPSPGGKVEVRGLVADDSNI